MAGVTGSQLQQLLFSAKYSDFTIICNDATFLVHKVILGSTFEYFRVLFESRFKESIESTVNFAEDDPEAIGTLLYYLYTGIYVKQVNDEFINFMERARKTLTYSEGGIQDKGHSRQGAFKTKQLNRATRTSPARLKNELSMLLPPIQPTNPSMLSSQRTRLEPGWWADATSHLFEPTRLKLQAEKASKTALLIRKNALNDQYSALQARFAAVNDSDVALSREIITLTSKLNASNTEITTLKGENECLKKQMVTVKHNKESKIRKLLDTGYLADFTIKCRKSTFRAHRAIIGSHSRYFDAIFRNNFKENVERSIELSDEEPATIYRLLSYLYTGTFPILVALQTKPDGTTQAVNESNDDIMVAMNKNPTELSQKKIRLALHGLVLLSEVADKHDCPELGEMITGHFDTFISALQLHTNKQATQEEATEISKNSELIEFVYTSTSPFNPALRIALTRSIITRRARSNNCISPQI